jgi:hypothetical protein
MIAMLLRQAGHQNGNRQAWMRLPSRSTECTLKRSKCPRDFSWFGPRNLAKLSMFPPPYRFILDGAEMAFRVTCPKCDKVLQLREQPAAGKKVKCPGCGQAFVPPREKAKVAAKPSSDDDSPRKKQGDEEDIDETPKKKKLAKSDEDDVDVEDEAPRKKKKKRDKEDDEDEGEDEDEEPRKKKKKKKKAGSSNVLYWVYRGGSVVVLVGLIAVLVVVLLFVRRPLRHESTVEVEPTVSRFSFVEAISSNQEVKVNATSTAGEFNIYLFLEKDKAAIESEMEQKGNTPAKVLASKTKTSEATLSAPIPANEPAVVMLTSAGKKVEVRLKISN